MANHGGGHDANWPCAGDQHVFAQDVKLKGRMHGIAERIKDRLYVSFDLGIVDPNVGHWQRDIFCKGSRAVHSNALGVFAKVAAACQAVPAMTADHMPFATYNFAHAEVGYVRAHLHDFTNKLMSYHHGHRNGFLRPGVPLVNVNIGATDSGSQDLDQHIIDADSWNRHLGQPEARPGLGFDKRFHCLHGSVLLANRLGKVRVSLERLTCRNSRYWNAIPIRDAAG